MLSEHEIENALIERHTKNVYEKLKESRVAIAGLGGLGSNIAVSLARIGVGHLLLVDFDTVDITNLNRQQYFLHHIGQKKTEALTEIIRDINPYIITEHRTVMINEKNAPEIFADYDIICEAFDKPENKAMLINTILAKSPEKQIISGNGMAGYLSANKIKTRKAMRNLYICGDETADIDTDGGLMAPRVAVCANHQAKMAVRLILGEKET